MKLEYIDLKRSVDSVEARIEESETEIAINKIVLEALRKEIAYVHKYPRPAKLPDKKDPPAGVG